LLRGTAGETWFPASVQPSALVGLESNRWKEYPLNLLYGSKILVVSGVANPAGLYRIIQEWEGEIVETLEFPDHHPYTATDWQRINRVARNAELVVTTEKDLVKLIRFPFAKDKLLALKVRLMVENGAALVDALAARIGRSSQ
jgi:tetraacyldisaccharide 4'-kinase